MINDPGEYGKYISLWEINDGSTYMVLRANDEQEYGNIVVSPEVIASMLHARGIQRGVYPPDSFLVEIVEDFDNLAEGVDIN